MNFNYCPDCGRRSVVQRTETKYECANCNWEYWNNPRATVAVIFIKDKQALFSKRGIEPNKGKYDFPGGFLEYNEDPYDACIREIKEETGIEISRQDLYLLEVSGEEYLTGVSVVDIIFIVTKWQGDFHASDDSESLEWKPLSFMKNKNFVPFYDGLETKITRFLEDNL